MPILVLGRVGYLGSSPIELLLHQCPPKSVFSGLKARAAACCWRDRYLEAAGVTRSAAAGIYMPALPRKQDRTHQVEHDRTTVPW